MPPVASAAISYAASRTLTPHTQLKLRSLRFLRIISQKSILTPSSRQTYRPRRFHLHQVLTRSAPFNQSTRPGLNASPDQETVALAERTKRFIRRIHCWRSYEWAPPPQWYSALGSTLVIGSTNMPAPQKRNAWSGVNILCSVLVDQC